VHHTTEFEQFPSMKIGATTTEIIEIYFACGFGTCLESEYNKIIHLINPFIKKITTACVPLPSSKGKATILSQLICEPTTSQNIPLS